MKVKKFLIKKGSHLEREPMKEGAAASREEAIALAERMVSAEGMPPGARPTLAVVFGEEGDVLGAAESFRDGHIPFSDSAETCEAVAAALRAAGD